MGLSLPITAGADHELQTKGRFQIDIGDQRREEKQTDTQYADLGRSTM